MTDREPLFSVTLKDCDVQVARGHGPGGQHRNTTNSAVRIVHRESGAVGYAQEDRSQHRNKVRAFERMANSVKFKVWLNREIWIRSGLPSPEEQVQKTMTPENLRVEIKKDGRWALEE